MRQDADIGSSKEIRFAISANYIATEEEVFSSQAVEQVLGAASLLIHDPLKDSQHRIYPRYYTAYFMQKCQSASVRTVASEVTPMR